MQIVYDFAMHKVSIFAAFFLALTPLYSAERPSEEHLAKASTRRAYFPPPDAAGGWRTATNAAQARVSAAIDLARLEQAWEFTQRCTQNGGLLVVRNGWLAFEKYFGRASRNANPDMASTGLCEHRLRHYAERVP